MHAAVLHGGHQVNARTVIVVVPDGMAHGLLRSAPSHDAATWDEGGDPYADGRPSLVILLSCQSATVTNTLNSVLMEVS